MITWRRAPRVAPGDFISASQADQLAEAWNDRLRNGPSLPWRRVNHLLHAFYAMRNPSGSLTPSVAEFFQFYQFLDPATGSWPETDAGLPEGANVSSQWPAFVFGVDGGATRSIDGEADRLTNPGAGGLNLDDGGGTPLELWELAKKQRGAYDPSTGGLASPALSAAASYSAVRYSATSPHGTDYGGFLAGPALTGDCATTVTSGSGDAIPIPNYAVFFTSLIDGTTRSFGTCPENPGDLAGVVQSPFAYYLILYSGQIVTLDGTKWVEGPYTANPVLRKTQNGFYGRAINRFAGDFRGTAAQVESEGVGSHVADVQGFLTSQYLLAPAYGVENAGAVSPIYPRVSIGGRYSPRAGFVLGAVFVRLMGFAQATAVEVLRDGVVAAVVWPVAQPDGSFQAIEVIDGATAGGVWSVRWQGTGPVVSGGQSVVIELAELMEYKPNVADLYLLLRSGGIEFGVGGMDGSGLTCEYPESITGDYFANGVIRSQRGHVGLPGQFTDISSNAVFDAARRLSRCVRWAHRWNVVGYAVIGGKSVLWFDRLARGLGNDTSLDIFEGLGPARRPIASGKIVWGRKYVVKGSGTVVYALRAYGVGETFVGVSGETSYSVTGAAEVWEVEGIRATAEPGGFTNEWLMGVELKPYNPSESSIWKVETFTDWLGNFDRCTFCDPAAAIDKRLAQHMAFGNRTVAPLAILTPENPEAYRYLPTTSNYYPRVNRALCDEGDADCIARRKAFYKSCPVFASWPAVESVVADGTDVVKVTLAGRLQYDADSAPGSVARDVGTWDVSALRAEPYRTSENGIREYLLWLATGKNGTVKIGDQSINSPCGSLDDAPFASMMPTFYFTQLIPRPHLDVNGDGDIADAYCFHDAMGLLELDLRAGCSAFVDGVTTARMTCELGTITDLYDFTFEDLMRQATGGKWMAPTATAATDYLGVEDVRPDSAGLLGGRPFGFGPLPSVIMTAQVFNWYGAAVDLLDTFRVVVPATLQFKTDTGYSLTNAVTYNAAGEVAPPGVLKKGSAGSYALYTSDVYGPPPTSNPGTWADSDNGSSSWDWVPVITFTIPFPSTWQVQSTSSFSSYRWAPENSDIDYALGAFSGALSAQPAIYGRVVTVVGTFAKAVVVGAYNGTPVHASGGSDDVWSTGFSGDGGGSGSAINWQTGHTVTTTTGPCGRYTGGSVPIPTGLSSFSYAARNFDGSQIDNDGGPSATATLTSSVTSTPSITVPLI